MKLKQFFIICLGLLLLAGCAHLTPEQQQEKATALFNQAQALLLHKPENMTETKQLQKVVEYLKESDSLGYAPAANKLAEIYSEPGNQQLLGIDKETRLASLRPYMERAAAGNIPEAQHRLGRAYAGPLYGFAKDDAKALQLWQQAADAGYRPSQEALLKYYASNDCADCGDQYVYWTQKLMENGSGNDQARLGLQFEKGTPPFPQDYAKAQYWYQKSMAQGSDVGYHYMGHLYFYGKGVPQDYAKARELMAQAAARENWGGGNHHMGEFYYNSLGVRRDYKQAFKYYYEGARQGYYGSMYMVAYMYLKGQGVKADRAQAKIWYEKARMDEYSDGYNNDKYLVPAKQALQRVFK